MKATWAIGKVIVFGLKSISPQSWLVLLSSFVFGYQNSFLKVAMIMLL